MMFKLERFMLQVKNQSSSVERLTSLKSFMGHLINVKKQNAMNVKLKIFIFFNIYITVMNVNTIYVVNVQKMVQKGFRELLKKSVFS